MIWKTSAKDLGAFAYIHWHIMWFRCSTIFIVAPIEVIKKKSVKATYKSLSLFSEYICGNWPEMASYKPDCFINIFMTTHKVSE